MFAPLLLKLFSYIRSYFLHAHTPPFLEMNRHRFTSLLHYESPEHGSPRQLSPWHPPTPHRSAPPPRFSPPRPPAPPPALSSAPRTMASCPSHTCRPVPEMLPSSHSLPPNPRSYTFRANVDLEPWLLCCRRRLRFAFSRGFFSFEGFFLRTPQRPPTLPTRLVLLAPFVSHTPPYRANRFSAERARVIKYWCDSPNELTAYFW